MVRMSKINNKQSIVVILIIITTALFIAACSQAPTTVETVQIQETPQEDLPYPPPGEEVVINPKPATRAYPAPGEEVDIQVEGTQKFQDGDEIMWLEAEMVIMSGEVESVVQTHDLKVTLLLNDGRRLFTEEPEIDEVIKVIGLCGDPCANIRVATE
jgi:hypothetical protein